MSNFISVSSTNFCDSTGTTIANATIWFQPVTSDGQPRSYRMPGGGLTSSKPVSAQVVNGSFSINLPDTSQTLPINIGFAVTVVDNLTGKQLLGPGYGCVQPTSIPNNWCSGGTGSLDLYEPNLAAQIAVQYGPQGTPGINGISFNPRGTFNQDDTYLPGDVVEYSGIAYGCVLENGQNPVGSAVFPNIGVMNGLTYWEILLPEAVSPMQLTSTAALTSSLAVEAVLERFGLLHSNLLDPTKVVIGAINANGTLDSSVNYCSAVQGLRLAADLTEFVTNIPSMGSGNGQGGIVFKDINGAVVGSFSSGQVAAGTPVLIPQNVGVFSVDIHWITNNATAIPTLGAFGGGSLPNPIPPFAYQVPITGALATTLAGNVSESAVLGSSVALQETSNRRGILNPNLLNPVLAQLGVVNVNGSIDPTVTYCTAFMGINIAGISSLVHNFYEANGNAITVGSGNSQDGIVFQDALGNITGTIVNQMFGPGVSIPVPAVGTTEKVSFAMIQTVANLGPLGLSGLGLYAGTSLPAIQTPYNFRPTNAYGKRLAVLSDSMYAANDNLIPTLFAYQLGMVTEFLDCLPGRPVNGALSNFPGGVCSGPPGQPGQLGFTVAAGTTLAAALADVDVLVISLNANNSNSSSWGTYADNSSVASLAGYQRALIETLIAANPLLRIIYATPYQISFVGNGYYPSENIAAQTALTISVMSDYGIPVIDQLPCGISPAIGGSPGNAVTPAGVALLLQGPTNPHTTPAGGAVVARYAASQLARYC